MKKLLYLIPILLLTCACGNNEADDGVNMPAQRAEGVIMRETSLGITSWQLKASSADFYDNQDVTMENPVITFNQGQKGEAVLKSKHGTFKEGVITFWGSVNLIVKDEKLKLNTDKLFYNTSTKIAWTNVPFTLKRNGITVKGKALKASNGFSDIEIFQQTTDLPKDLQGLK